MTIKHQRWNIDIDEHYMRYETNNVEFRLCFARMFDLCMLHDITAWDEGANCWWWPGMLYYSEFAVEYRDFETDQYITETISTLKFINTFVFDIADALVLAR
jgi:hypothetical protein